MELIELIRKNKSRHVAIFQRKKDLDNSENNVNESENINKIDDSNTTNNNDIDKENVETHNKLNFIPIKTIYSNEDLDKIKDQLKYNEVTDVTDKFKQHFLSIGTYGILSALQNMVNKNEFISVNFYGQNRCEIDKVLEINNQFHIIKVKDVEEEETLSSE